MENIEKDKKKGWMKIVITVIMMISPFILSGCSNGQDAKDETTNSPVWHYSEDYTTYQGTVNTGDFFIDTNDYVVYQKTTNGWTVVMNISDKLATTPQIPSEPEITVDADGYWCINGKSTGIKAKNDENEQPVVMPKIEIKNGYWYIDGKTTNVKAEAREIKNISSAYEYDSKTNTEYYVFTFTYTDGTVEKKKMEIPKKVNEVLYIGESKYYMCNAGDEPSLNVRITYEDLTTEDIEITNEMYIIDDTYTKPNFQVEGNYNVKVSYRGVITTFMLNIVDPSKQMYTITTPKYKNLQKFSHWQDDKGNTVSEELTYSYYALSEKNYKAVYVDFIELDGALLDSQTYYDSTNKKYVSTSDGENGWLKMAYLTEPLTKGMYVEFTINNSKTAMQLLWGISTKSYVEEYNASPTTKGWLSNDTTQNLNKLFVAEYNFYSGMEISAREKFAYLKKIPTLSSIEEGKIFYEDASIDIGQTLSNNENVKIKFVLDDQLLMYVDDQLFTASNLQDMTIANSQEYYLSLSGNNANISITDIGFDKYITMKGKFSNPVSNPLQTSAFAGKTITFLGDSITYGVGVSNTSKRYSTVLANSLGMIENNMGISGTVISTGGHRTSRLGDISKISYNSDYVGVLLGVNDFDQCKNDGTTTYYSLGEFGSKDTTTIYGALDKMCSDLVKRFRSTDTKVFLMTPVITSWNNSVTSNRDWDQSKKNACGYTLRELSDAIETVARHYGIVTLDLNEDCVMSETDFADGIHPNDSGAQKMADTIKTFLLENYQYNN